MNKKTAKQEYNPDELKAYMAVPAKEKLRFLEEMNAFFLKVVPSKNKAAWAKLKAKGW